ncbi:MAG: Sec-independent protein translocase TatB [Kineosporiaceae bacterium]
MFGVNPSEFLVLLLVAAVVLGPERLPQYAQQLARLVRELSRMAQGAADQAKAEMGPEFDDVDWQKLDPRQYDPRRIVREALADAVDLDDPLGLAELKRGDDRRRAGNPAEGDSAPAGNAPDTGAPEGTGTPGTAPGNTPAPGAPGRTEAGPAPFDPDAT